MDRYDKHSGKWGSASIEHAVAKWGGADIDCLGSVMNIEPIHDFFALDTHLNPSAGCILLLSRDLKLKTALCGWTVGHFQGGSIIYERSQVHFAAVHPAEIAFYNPHTNSDYAIFPRKPYQKVRLELIARLRQFYETHQDYCQKANDPCDAESFDSSLVGKVIADDRQHAVAFVISYALQGYGHDQNKPSGSYVVYVYRHVDDPAKLEYREMTMDGDPAQYARQLERFVEPDVLDRIFASTASEK